MTLTCDLPREWRIFTQTSWQIPSSARGVGVKNERNNTNQASGRVCKTGGKYKVKINKEHRGIDSELKKVEDMIQE